MKSPHFQIDLNIAYGKSYNDEVVQYYQYGVKAFYADVGGLLGLFLGVSILSFYDFVIASATHLRKRFSSWREKRKSVNNNGAIIY